MRVNGETRMGEVASVVRFLSCKDCARYVCNDASFHSQCCDENDVCNCDIETRETEIQESHIDYELSVDRNCILRISK